MNAQAPGPSGPAEGAAARCGIDRRTAVVLIVLFVLALVPRLHGALTVGRGWDGPGSFTLINFDEGGSCRAALGGFDYSTFVGRQTIALASILGEPPSEEVAGDEAAARRYCHGAFHIRVARVYSAIAGALTVVLVTLLTRLLVPGRPAVAWTAGLLLCLSGFHIAQSQTGTVDAASVMFVYLFLTVLVFAVRSRSRAWTAVAAVLSVPAVWAKWWAFALFSALGFVPSRVWAYVTHGLRPARIAGLVLGTAALFATITNSAFRESDAYPLLALFYLLVPWRRIHRPMIVFWLLVPFLAYLVVQPSQVVAYTTGHPESRFGSGYGAIGWGKLLRNAINLPALLIVALGLPACAFVPVGVRALARTVRDHRILLCLAPLGVFALFMAFLASVTYYRHYLVLVPAAAMLAALGVHATRWMKRPWFAVLFFLWPALLAVDLVSDYHLDPRIELRRWYREHANAKVFYSFYVSPPARTDGSSRLFRPEYAFGDAEILRRADYLVLSENWYDTAFANELNGPLVGRPERLIKTTTRYTRFYRDALAGRHPNLVLERSIEVGNFMPELVVHRRAYGTFQLFVGDLKIFRVVD